jgi:hypothetical protein
MSKTSKNIGGKEAAAQYCWDALTDQRDPETYNLVTDTLLAHAAAMAIKAGYGKPTRDAMRFIAEYSWKEGFIAAMASQECGAITRVEIKMPQAGKEGVN